MCGNCERHPDYPEMEACQCGVEASESPSLFSKVVKLIGRLFNKKPPVKGV